MVIRTPRLIVRSLQRTDVDSIAVWQPFADPSRAHYNILAQSIQERDTWLALRAGDPTRREFVIALAVGQVIGRIELREIDGQGCARLGIGLDEGWLDRGLGTEAMTGFLDWYFSEGGFTRMVLDVSAANRRAVHIYEKLGFRHVGEFQQSVDEAAVAFLDDPRYASLRPYFRREGGKTWALSYEMELTHGDWQTNIKSQISNVKSE